MNLIRFAVISAALATAAGTLAYADDTTTMSASNSVTITMKAENGSKEDGSATITPSKDGVEVIVHLIGAKGKTQPTHIHVGTCDNINKAPEFALINTVDGLGKTDVKGVTIKQLLGGKYAINVHKSADDLATYVSCGNIKSSK